MADSSLKTKLKEKIEAHRPRTAKLNKEFGEVIIDKVNIGQCIGGARDIRALVTDISYLDPQEGIRFRGKTIPETFEALPKVPGSDQPYVEGFFWYLITGEVPNIQQTMEVVEDWRSRSTSSTCCAPCRATRTPWCCSPRPSWSCSASRSSRSATARVR